MPKYKRFSGMKSIGKTKGKDYYEFGTGFPETIRRNDKQAKIDQGLFQPDQNLNNLQTGDNRD